MLVVSDCQLSHHPDYIIGWSSIQPARHPTCFDISYDALKNIYTECVNTKIDGWAILVKNDRDLQSFGIRLYCLLDCQSVLSAVGFLLKTCMALWKGKQLVDLPDEACVFVSMNGAR